LNLEGHVQLDAILMNGNTLKAGAIAAVERVRNPIRLARAILEKSEHMMLVGAGAEKFAIENGLPLCAAEELVTPTARAAWLRCREIGHSSEHHSDAVCPVVDAQVVDGGSAGNGLQGTVGAVAWDSHGELAAGTSTGGTCCKLPGRVGDSPLIGCGCYADVDAGGVSSTGNGEGIMKIVMAKMAADLLRDERVLVPHRKKGGTPSMAQAVADACVRKLAQRGKATGGLILLDREGHPAAAFNTPRMAYGYVEPDGVLRAFP
jgi:L-asparaginase / beta-aspartyl-peptidase